MNSNEILQKIADNILKKLAENQCGSDVKLIIYMDDDFYQKLMADTYQSDNQASQTWEFGDKYTIIGYQVFRVIPQYTREGTIRHPDYEIAILGAANV